jgi:anti-anti-sigma regulatory factor
MRAVLGMTFRIQRSTAGDVVVLSLSGDIAADQATELQSFLGAEAERRIVIDLKEVAVVDRAGVLLLARSEVQGATLTNCPGYVREWIDRERDH